MITTSGIVNTYSIPEIELSFRYPVSPITLPKITNSSQAYKALISTWDHNRIELIEQFKVLLINRSSRLLGIYELSSGGTNATIADPKLIFAAALKSVASGIILAHNHPSGSLSPSIKDINLTRKIKQGAALLDIEVIDHLILTKESYLSMAEKGLL
jgi:DNA repair protein RadC